MMKPDLKALPRIKIDAIVQKTGDFGQVLNDDSKTISLMKTPWG
jgi:hypothetical protein